MDFRLGMNQQRFGVILMPGGFRLSAARAGDPMMHTLAWMPGPWEWIAILVVALLIFGRRLPEVGRSLGRGLVEFKKGLKGVKDELEEVDRDVDDAVNRADDDEPRKLDPPRADPTSTAKAKDKAESNA